MADRPTPTEPLALASIRATYESAEASNSDSENQFGMNAILFLPKAVLKGTSGEEYPHPSFQQTTQCHLHTADDLLHLHALGVAQAHESPHLI